MPNQRCFHGKRNLTFYERREQKTRHLLNKAATAQALVSVITQLEEIFYAEKQYWDNIPINLQNAPAYEAAEQAATAMEEALELLYQAY